MKAMKRICLVSLYPSHYRDQIYHMMEEELDCSFIFGQYPSSIKQLDLSSFKRVKEVDNLPIGKGRLYRMPGTIKHLKGYDVIIDDMGILCITSWYNLLMSKLRRQDVFIWSHGWYGREGFVKKWIKRLYSHLSKGMFVYGEYAKQLMVKNGFEEAKLHVIHNSLNYDQQLVLRRSMKQTDIFTSFFKNNNPVLCFIGRLTKVKRLDQILSALSLLKQKSAEFNLVFIGEGEVLDDLKQQAERFNMTQQVWLYGACYDERTIAELLYNSDLCVAPGNIGLTAMHAMMFGCPCLSHNDFSSQMPEFEAIKEGVTGLFFEKDSIDSLSESISKWFSEYSTDRESVRQSCYNEIDTNWNPHHQIEIIKKVING